MSGNLTTQPKSELDPQLEKLARAQHNPTAFLVSEAINNFVKLNLNHPGSPLAGTGQKR
ncbi:hypothetical protein SG34_018975 [Thalassomonas viridans]|uniref:Uncharacterized protein n=1 Tax=Thalassomonas viridans TaxID=137584 RepID=A0AAF0C835_9GAMM|nr:hypothetical protein [Thalassomonas viridans]WDE03464.1 hypothetical protein SG34_018975 [Thalassomonas viridans]